MSDLKSLIDRLEGCVVRFESTLGLQPTSQPISEAQILPPPPQQEDSRKVREYKQSVLSKVEQFQSACAGTDILSVVQAGEAIAQAFQFNIDIIRVSEGCAKPTQDELNQFIVPQLQRIQNNLQALKNSSKEENNLILTFIEGAQTSGWPYSDMQADFVQNFKDAAMFYGNRVLRQKNNSFSACNQAFMQAIDALWEYTKQYPVNWDGRGIKFSDKFASAAQSAPSAPPAQPAPTTQNAPAQRQQAVKEPKKYQQSLLWFIENYSNDRTLEITEEEADMRMTIVLVNLSDCIVQIKGKVKSIQITGCKGTGVLCYDVVSSTEVINCSKIQLQTMGLLPGVSIDKSNQVQLILNEQSATNFVIHTSQSSDMSMLIPDPENPEDQKEVAIPHVFTHRLNAGSVETTVSDVYGQ